MNCLVKNDVEVEQLAMHPGLLPANGRSGPPKGTRDCVQKTGVVMIRKPGVAKPRDTPVKQVTTGPEKTISCH